MKTNIFRKSNLNPPRLKDISVLSKKDLNIAKRSYIPEVIFKFSYDALIKLGIALIAERGYKVRSVVGHHVKILEKMAEILQNTDIEVIGNQMRQKRNTDLYEGGFLISKKDSQAYLEFIESVFKKAHQLK